MRGLAATRMDGLRDVWQMQNYVRPRNVRIITLTSSGIQVDAENTEDILFIIGFLSSWIFLVHSHILACPMWINVTE